MFKNVTITFSVLASCLLEREMRPSDAYRRAFERVWYWNDQAEVPFWDGMIVALADRAKCKFLLSENLQAAAGFSLVAVLNPFETSPPVA